MKTRLLNLWSRLRSNYWFLPGLMALAAMTLAFATLYVDGRWGKQLTGLLPWAPGNEPEGARSFLSTLAGATITVTGVVFSITVVALSLASQQFGPRLLNNFMRDRGNQAVFGTFIATFLFSLLVLRTIRGGDDLFVPHLSVLLGFLLALFSVAVLIYFIHHTAESIQAMTVIARVSEDLHRTVEKYFPLPEEALAQGLPAGPGEIPGDFHRASLPLPADEPGYIQAVDEEGLLALAVKRDLLLRLERRSGQFVLRGTLLARAWPGEAAQDEDLTERVNAAILLGPERSPGDLEYRINELVEIAVRSLSPGINDPFTAIQCLDHLGSALRELAGRAPPSAHRRDGDGRLRLILDRPTFGGMVAAALDPIRQHGRTYVEINLRLLDIVGEILPHTRTEEQRRALLRQAGMVERSGRELPEKEDREEVHRQYQRLFEILGESFGLSGDLA